MCFFGGGSAPAVNTNVAAAPKRTSNSGLAKQSQLMALRSKGVFDTIASSPLGDIGYGRNARATKLGGGGATSLPWAA